MPRTYVPPSNPSDDARAAMSVFQAGTLRAEIIRDLAQHPEGATTAEIGSRIGVIYQQVYKHVAQLREEGIVTVLGQGAGYRRGPIYQLDRAALEATAAAFVRHLLGE